MAATRRSTTVTDAAPTLAAKRKPPESEIDATKSPRARSVMSGRYALRQGALSKHDHDLTVTTVGSPVTLRRVLRKALKLQQADEIHDQSLVAYRALSGQLPTTQLDRFLFSAQAAADTLQVSPEQIVIALANQFAPELAAEAEQDDGSASPEAVLARELGPYLTGRAVAQRAKVTRQALQRRRDTWALIGIPTDDHAEQILYPVKQFKDPTAAATLDGVQQAAKVLAKGINDRLTIAIWLDSANDVDLAGMTAYEWLRRGKPCDAVLQAATRDVRRWQQ